MLRAIAVSGTALAAVGAATFSNIGDSPDGLKATRSATQMAAAPARVEELCLIANFPLIQGMNKGCYARAELVAFKKNAVLDNQGRPVVMEMTSPDDWNKSAECRSCGTYEDMVFEGWYGLSGKDMRRAQFLNAHVAH